MQFIESFIVLVGIKWNDIWLFKVRKKGFNQCESQTQHKTELLYSAEKEPQLQINIYKHLYSQPLFSICTTSKSRAGLTDIWTLMTVTQRVWSMHWPPGLQVKILLLQETSRKQSETSWEEGSKGLIQSGVNLGFLVLDRQVEFKLCWKLILRIQPVWEVDASYSTVCMDLRGKETEWWRDAGDIYWDGRDNNGRSPQPVRAASQCNWFHRPSWWSLTD